MGHREHRDRQVGCVVADVPLSWRDTPLMAAPPRVDLGVFLWRRKGVVPLKPVVIRGRNRQETRKKTLDYWFSNRDQFDCSMKDFLRKCCTDPTGRVVMYKG